MTNRVVQTFEELRSAGKKTLLPFVTAGYPDMETTLELLKDFAARGVRICELGVPFSDPVADGPVIQASYTEALNRGVTSDKILEMVRCFRAWERSGCHASAPLSSAEACGPSATRHASGKESGSMAPANPQLSLLLMVSYSIVFRHGPAAYFDQAADAGIDGFIIPDLPLDEAAEVESFAAQRGLANVMLIAPTTPPVRRQEIAAHSRGFIYFMSIAGITGERTKLPEATIAGVAELRKHTDTPVCVGFGVSNPQTVAEVCRAADGAIVGSAIVHRLTDATKQGLDRSATVKQVGQFVGQLLEPVK